MFLSYEITLPFSYDYTRVLQLVSVLAHSLLYFYLFWLSGSALLSYYYEFIKRSDPSTVFAKRLIDLTFRKLSFPLVLGILPFLVVFSIDLIWLRDPTFKALHNWSIVSLVIFLFSIPALYYYKFSFALINILPKTVIDKESSDFLNLMENSLKNHKRSALFGTLGILITLYLVSVLNVARVNYNPTDYNFDFIAYTLRLDVNFRFLFNLILSFSVTYLINLFLNFVWDDTKLKTTEGLSEFMREKLVKGAFVTVLLQPVFILLEVLILPRNSLSYWVFISSGIVLILLFLISNQLKAYRKEYLDSYLRYSFYLIVLAVIFISVKDVVVFANVIKPETVKISQSFLSYEENLKTKLNIKTVTFSGEEIFTAKCSACHRFDQKLVGPPYNVVLQKYENKKDQLVKFILNPVKVDPAYPPMPAQGLIPPEAEAVADYIMKVYQENKK